MEHSSSLIADSTCVAANGGCIGLLIVGGGDTATMCPQFLQDCYQETPLVFLGHQS